MVGSETATLGRPRLHLRSTGSTNERARALAMAGAPHGTLVTADEQTAGRGRQGRVWCAPAGSSLLCSLVLRWPSSDPPPELLSLKAGVAVCDVVGESARLKWPNDVVVGSDLAKLAGVLVESRPQEQWAVLGIGVNVAVRLEDLPAEVRDRAASLERPASAVEPLLEDLLLALARRLGEPDVTVLDAWGALDALRDRDVAWGQGRGRAEGIDSQGRLVVRLGDGTTTALSASEVHLASTA